MTQEYKDNVLKYTVGILEQQTGQNDPEFKNVLATQNNLKTNLGQYFDSMVTYTAFVPSKNIQDQDLGYSVLACFGTLVGQENPSGALVILDENYNIIKFLSTYSDNTLMGIIRCLNVDNQGNFYGIEESNGTYKIIALNNIVLKRAGQIDYEAVKTSVMTIPNQYTWDNMLKIQRDDTGNRYFILGRRNVSSVYSLVGIHLEIADQLTWTYYTTNYDLVPALQVFNQGFYVYWDNDNTLHYNIAVDDYGLVILSEQNSNIMKATKYLTTDMISSYSNFVFYSNQIGYYASVEDLDTYTLYMITKVNLLTKETEIIYTEKANYDSRNQLWFFKNSNDIMFYKITTTGTTDEYELSVGLINDTRLYMEQIGTYTGDTATKVFCYANAIKKYNQNYVYIQNQDTVFTFDFDWNSNNYNGEAYLSNTSLIPNSISIEDENEIELFNRNLYNLSQYANYYIATGQIPNYSLNEQIDTALLYSKNNNLMCSKYLDITKNIYEQVNINFINKFNIKDTDTNIVASSRLVNSMINNDTQAYIGKYRINYHDNTTSIKNLSTNEYTLDNSKVNIFFVIYVDKLIDSIDLISYDEETIYKTIDCSNLEQNKYYKISQDIRIE